MAGTRLCGSIYLSGSKLIPSLSMHCLFPKAGIFLPPPPLPFERTRTSHMGADIAHAFTSEIGHQKCRLFPVRTSDWRYARDSAFPIKRASEATPPGFAYLDFGSFSSGSHTSHQTSHHQPCSAVSQYVHDHDQPDDFRMQRKLHLFDIKVCSLKISQQM